MQWTTSRGVRLIQSLKCIRLSIKGAMSTRCGRCVHYRHVHVKWIHVCASDRPREFSVHSCLMKTIKARALCGLALSS